MSQFIEMFDFNDLSLTSPANDFSKYCKDDTSSATKIVAGDYLSKGIYPIYDQSKDNTIAGYTNKKEGLCDNVPAVLFGDHSRVIKYINTPFFIGADGVKIIRPKINEIIPEFLYYDLKYHTIPNTGYNRHFKFVKMLKLTKASMEKQNEFLLIARQADKSKFGDFKSQFIEMFGNPVTNTKGWKTAKIKDVAPEMPSKEQLSGKIWLLNLDMIESNTGRIIEKVYEDVENALSVQSFDEGNVLFSKLRPYLNKVVIPDGLGMATTELVPLRPEPSKLHKVFLSHLLRGNQFVNYANDIAGGTKMPRMPLTELRNFDCILPPMDKQLEFVFIAEQADKSKSVIQKALVYLNDIQSDELGKIA